MTPTRIVLAVVAAQLVAFAAFAQSSEGVPSSSEFGRAHGGQIDASAKEASNLSGSLGMTHTSSRGRGYGATLGGSLVDDRLWFFGSASLQPAMRFDGRLNSGDAKVTAQPAGWLNVTGAFSGAFSGSRHDARALPASFLSLRSTGVLAPNGTFSINVSRETRTPAATTPFDPR